MFSRAEWEVVSFFFWSGLKDIYPGQETTQGAYIIFLSTNIGGENKRETVAPRVYTLCLYSEIGWAKKI